jgi:hypothetical protein
MYNTVRRNERSTFVNVATVYSPECRFGAAAISTINTNKKIVSKLQNKETESADEGQEAEETGNAVW